MKNNDEEFESDARSVQDEKQERAARIIYVVLAVMITAAMVVSVISAINRRRSDKTPVLPDVSDTESGTVTDKPKSGSNGKNHSQIDLIPDTPATKAPAPKDPATEPEKTEPEPQTDVKETKPEEPASVDRIYVVPTAGSVIKDYTMDLPVYSLTMNDYRVHNGVDIAAPVGSPVYAFCDGTVKRIYTDPMMGQTVIIEHGDGLESRYQNLQITLADGITEGCVVTAGEIIGAVGETAMTECAEVPHLHFSVFVNGKCAAPAEYIGSIDPTFDE